MEPYREASAALPFVTTLRGHLMGIDVDSGALRWQHAFMDGVGHIAIAGARVFVASDLEQHVRVLDRATGRELGAVQLGFPVASMLVIGDRIVFSGHEACVGMTLDGQVLYRIGVQVVAKSEKLFENDKRDIVAIDATGREAWRFRVNEVRQTRPLIAHDERIDMADP